MKKFGKFLKGAYLGIVVLFMYLPIAVMLVMSFTDSRSAAIWNGFSFGAYTALFSDGDVMDALLTTLLVAVISSILATVIGTATAIGLHSMKKRPRAVVESITQSRWSIRTCDRYFNDASVCIYWHKTKRGHNSNGDCTHNV